MRTGLKGSIAGLALLICFTTTAFAQSETKTQSETKSWEVDLYDGDADITYVDDGYDDVHVYDHNNHNNDRSYIVDEPSYAYRDGYRDSGYRGGYGYYDDRHAYAPRHYRPRSVRVEYHHDYGYGHGYRGW